MIESWTLPTPTEQYERRITTMTLRDRIATLVPNQPRAGARTVRRARIDAPTFLLHWSLFVSFVISLLAGLRIAADYDGSPAGILSRYFLAILPEGRVIEAHVLSGWAVGFIAVAYAAFIWRSRQSGRIKLRRADLNRVSQDLPIGRPAGWLALHRTLTLVAFSLIILLSTTGLMMYRGIYFGVSGRWVAAAHGLAAWAMVAYLVLHVLTVAKAGTFLKMFFPRSAYIAAGATGIVAAVLVIGVAFMVDRTVRTDLRVPRVAVAPVLDGENDDPAWTAADPVRIHTTRGANLPNGEALVEVRAVHDGERIYFLFRWRDPTRSQKMLPLIKDNDGWRVLQAGYELNDTNDYYEDKFAAIFSTRPALGSGTTHLGQNLIEGPHYPNPRGLHYSEDASIVDLWHWKSVRSGGFSPGFVDDNYIGPPLPSETAGARYTGGYTQDPPSAPHPYLLNWTKVNPELPLDETAIIPRYLPSHPDILRRMAPVVLDAHAHDEGTWFFGIEEAVPYREELDDYPVGTVLPGIVLERPFEGDRADVRAEANWRDGYWTLETARLLDTGSPYDVAFAPEGPVYMWVAVFDHTQTRHSQHLQPVRIFLD